MRRTVALLLAAAALLAPRATHAQTIAAGLGGNASSLVGQPVDIPVIVDMTNRPDRLGAFALTIRWKASVLQFQQGLGGTFGAVTANTDSVVYGIIRLTGANPAGVGGLVTLGIGRFVPLTADTTTLALTFSQLYAAGTFADLRPSLTVTSGQYCSAVGRYGDINGDGVINSADALIALTNAVGLPTGAYPVALGDVDSSGVTDTRDALIMLSDAVGIDVSAFPRVDRMLGGACAASAPVTMAITPTSVNGVLVGQEVTFEARATGPTGALVAIPTAVYRSSNPAILAFNDDSGPSSGTALAPGTVTVTAVRDGKDSAQTTVTVVGRRTTHWVDAKAAAAPNQLGTQGLPFATIAAALAIAHAGDTVRPQPGRYEESVVADSAVVLLGDTLSDGTRPVLAGNAIGIVLAGPGSSELQNLELDGYADAIAIAGPSQVLLRGIRTAGVGFGILTGTGILTRLQIESSRLVGAGPSAAGDGVNLGSTEVDSLIVSGTEISDFGTDGVYGNEVLYVAVHGSSLHDLGNIGVEAGSEAPSTFVVDSTSIANTFSWSARLSNVQFASFAHDRLINTPVGNNYTGYYTGVLINGNGGGWVSFRGDSIEQTSNGDPEWLSVAGLDSLRIDSLWARMRYGYGYVLDVPLVRVTNSQFVNLYGSNLAVSYSGNQAGGRVVIDSVSATGDPACDLCSTGFQISNAATTITNFSGTNLGTGLSVDGDSGLTVTGSEFQHVAVPVEWNLSDAGSGSRLVVRTSQFVGFQTAVMTTLGAVAVDTNDFQVSQSSAVQIAEPEGSVRVVGNTFADVWGGVNVSATQSVPVTIAGNNFTGIRGDAIVGGGGGDSANVTYTVDANQVACAGAGALDGYGMNIELASAAIAGNLVQGCYIAMAVYNDYSQTSATRGEDIVGNTVSMAGAQNPYAGITVQGMVNAHVANNTVTADTTGYMTYGVISVVGDSTSGGTVTAQVDSNTVTGGTNNGIYVRGVDSAVVSFNSVQNVANAGGCGGCGNGGITIGGPVRLGALIHGNIVRNIVGTGISAANTQDVPVVVDSNLVSGNIVGLSLGQYGGLGPVVVTRNRITGNTVGPNHYGVLFYYANAETSVADSNNIVGNGMGASTADGNYYQMQNNWWGDASGPTCGEPCSGGATGDSVAVSNINPWPWLSVPVPSDLPLNAPPMHLAKALRFSATPKPVAVPSGAAVRHAASLPRLASPAAATRPIAAFRAPAGLKPAQAQQLGIQWSRRAAERAAQMQAQTARAGKVAAGAASRAAWLASVERGRAQRDSVRAERVREQAAAEQARHARQP